MGLSLTLKRGQDFLVSGQSIYLDRIESLDTFVLSWRASGKCEEVRFDTDHAIELFPSVWVAGDVRDSLAEVRVNIDAPRSIKIILGDLDRRGRRNAPRHEFGASLHA